MDDKKIEEMSKIVDKVFRCYYKGDYESGIKDFATHLVEFGAIVLPEGSVVFTQEEYLRMVVEERALDKASEEKARKQAVKEVLKEIDKELYETSRIYLEAVTKNSKDEDAINKYGVMSIAHDVVIKISKQYGVEVKE